MRSAIAWLLLCCSALADEVPTVDLQSITLPMEPVEELAPSDPTPISTVKPDEWYVVASSVPLIVLTSPDGVVRVEREQGPLKLRGKFAGGGGKLETRTYREEYLVVVEALKPGTTELILIPEGVTDASAIVRQVLTVSGLGPQPPPDPKPEPEPQPGPTASHVTIAVVEDALNRSPQTAICLNALAGWNKLKDAGHDWRLYDIKTREAAGKQALADATAANQALPAIVVRDKDSGKLLRVAPLPATIDGVKAIVAELTGDAL